MVDGEHAASTREALVSRLERAADSRSRITFWPSGASSTFAELWAAASLPAEALRSLGPGVLGLTIGSDAGSLQAMFAAWQAGWPVVSIRSPAASAAATIAATCGVRLYASTDERDLVQWRGSRAVAVRDLLAGRPPEPDAPPRGALHPGTVLAQCSSGTTRNPRAACLTGASLLACIDASLERLGLSSPLRVTTWLPLSHDMGLIGTFLLPWIAAADGPVEIHVLPTSAFQVRPFSWLALCSETRATLTATAPSALTSALQWARRRPCTDLSSMEAVVVGAELIDAHALSELDALLAAAGAPPRAVRPAYGCAEMALTVSMTERRDAWRPVRHNEVPRRLRPVLGQEQLVSCGTAVRGATIDVDDALELTVSGESLMTGYAGGPTVREHPTGDIGFLDDRGDLVPCGRADDWISTRGGQVLWAPTVERVAKRLLPLRPNAVAAVADGAGGYALVYEARRQHDLGDELRRLAVEAYGRAPSTVRRLSKGEFPFTNSGKVQRGEAAALALAPSTLTGGGVS